MAYFLYDSFRERTRAEILAHIIHLEDRRLLSSELTEYLSNHSLEIRGRAAMATGRIGGPESGQQLLPLLEDSSLDVASIAAFAIGLSGETQYAATLTDMALDLPSSVAASAVKAAGRLADSSMAEVMASLTGYLSHPSPEVREAACFGLFYAGGRSAAPDVMMLLISEKDPKVRLAALYMLARLGIAEAGEIYVEFLAESDPFTRSLALRGLSQSTFDRAGHYLAIALNDDDPRVVAQAIAGLTDLGSDTTSIGSGKKGQTEMAIGKLADKLARETDEKLVVALIDGLRRCQSELGVNEVISRLNADPPDNVVAAAVRYLAVARGDRVVSLIDSLLIGRPQARLRAACAEAFGLIDIPGVLPRLAVLFGDEDPMVRAAAFGVLISLDSANADFYIDKALNDHDFVPVSLAVDEIGSSKRKSYLPVLRTLISNPEETELDIKRSVLAAVIPFLQENKEDSSVTEILLTGLLDPDYVVRKDAAAIYLENLSDDHRRLVGPAHTRITERDIEKAIEKYIVNPVAEVTTSRGSFDIELLFEEAPMTVMNFIELAESGFYDGLALHRVIPNFVAQGGDPRGDGWGGPAYTIRCEYSDQPYERGTVGIATSGKDTGGSQFFITFSPQPHLDARYTVFGQVRSGMDVVDQLVVGDLIEQILIRDGQS